MGHRYPERMPEWSAELAVDSALATALIAEQMPGLAGAPLRPLATGWDNTVFEVAGQWAFRFPRRAVAVPGLEREIELLGPLAARLELPIPVPAWVGHPSPSLGYPWPFFGAPLLAGREVADADPTDAERGSAARPLARFLRALHGPNLLAALGTRLPVDPVRRADMSFRVPRTRERLAELAAQALWEPPGSVRELLDAAERLPGLPATAVVHGDLHIRHLLLGAGGRIAGVIDWGDLALADPSVDLVLYWSFLPPGAREAFAEEYGTPTGSMLLRSRVLSLFLCATLAIYAAHEGHAALLGESVAGLERTVAG